MAISSLTHGAVDAVRNIGEFAADLTEPTIRLGVTGLSRAGKTVFITALVHNLLAWRPPAGVRGRGARARRRRRARAAARRRGAALRLRGHMADADRRAAALAGMRRAASASCASPSTIESQNFWTRQRGADALNLDIVDYPGEWLLDLPLLSKSYAEWSREALRSRRAARRARALAARIGTRHLPSVDPAAPADERRRARLARLFTDYLRACRDDAHALSTAAARPLPDAGRPRRLAGADLRAARRRRRASAPARLALAR